MSFAHMAQWLQPAKLNYACSAHYLDHVDAVNLSEEQQALLKEIGDATFRETVRDFMCNTQFRRDYWIKGARQIGAFERAELLRAQRVVLVNAREAVELKVAGVRGEATLNDSVYSPILDLLANYKPWSLGQIEEAVKGRGLVFAQVLQAVMVLIAKGDLALAQDDAVVSRAKRMTDKLNLALMSKSRSSNDIAFLASPLTGGGLAINRFQQLFLLARSQGRKQPQEWAQFAWQHLEAMNQRLLKEGQPISSIEDNLTELNRLASEFAEKRLPILKALLVA